MIQIKNPKKEFLKHLLLKFIFSHQFNIFYPEPNVFCFEFCFELNKNLEKNLEKSM